MALNRKKMYIEKSVLDAALERTEYLFINYDNVVVSFSGGKDSTAALWCAYEVAKKLNRLPLHIQFFDEEAIHPPTIDYVERVRKNPDFHFTWYCLPIKHRNACSNEQPYWYCWNPEKEDVWVRPMPDNVVTEHPAFIKGKSFQENHAGMLMHDFNGKGSICVIQGIRTQESLRRYRVIAKKKNDAFISRKNGFVFSGYPIYDWESNDVWRLVHEKQIDYNRTYDIFNKTSMFGKLLQQRVCPPFGEQPLRGLWLYAECFPQMWEKMLYRVPGVATAWRYSNTALWLKGEKPDFLTWEEMSYQYIQGYSDELRPIVIEGINKVIREHFVKTDIPIHEEDPHPVTGLSWKFICDLAKKADLKGRYRQSVTLNSDKVLAKMKITLDDAVREYCRASYQEKYFAQKSK